MLHSWARVGDEYHRYRAGCGDAVLLVCDCSWATPDDRTNRYGVDCPTPCCPTCREIVLAIEAGMITSWPAKPLA